MEALKHPSPQRADMSDLVTAITAATTAFNLLKGAVAMRDEKLVATAQAEMQLKLNEASAMSFSQLQDMHSLELETQKLRTELGKANAREERLLAEIEQRRRYKLAQPAPGKWANLRVEDAPGPPETTAYFCTSCQAEKREVPLQFKAPSPGMSGYLICPVERRHSLDLGGSLPQGQRPQHDDPFARNW